MSYREARTKHDKIKLMTYIRHIQQSLREKKERTKKINVYQLHNTSIGLLQPYPSITVLTKMITVQPVKIIRLLRNKLAQKDRHPSLF